MTSAAAVDVDARVSAPPLWATPRTSGRPTYGPAVAKLAAMLGTPLMPWQRLVLDVALEVMPDGTWAYRTIVVTVQRQAGKTTLIGPWQTHRCLTRQDVLTWLTAQRRQDARDTWLQIVKRLRNSPLAPPRIKVRESNGSETVTYPSGSTFRPFAPTRDALHGKANELVFVDEPWAFDAAQGDDVEAAVLPTFTTTGGQLVLTSTAGTEASEYLAGYVDLGRAAVGAGQTDTLAYFEWALASELIELVTAGVARDASTEARDAAFAALLAAHPGTGYTLREDVLEQMLQAAHRSKDGGGVGLFLRGFGNVWMRTADRVIPEHVWNPLKPKEWPAPAPGSVAFGFDASPDHADAALMASWTTAAGKKRYDVIAWAEGTGWLASTIREKAALWRPVAIGYDAAGPALDVADELVRGGGLPLLALPSRDYAAACAAWMSEVRQGRSEHPGHPVLDDAVAAAAQRNLGDAWVWARRHAAGSIAALVGATAAGWAYDHRPDPPEAPVIVVR